MCRYRKTSRKRQSWRLAFKAQNAQVLHNVEKVFVGKFSNFAKKGKGYPLVLKSNFSSENIWKTEEDPFGKLQSFW